MPRKPSLPLFLGLAFSFTWCCWLSIGAARAGWIRPLAAEETLATCGQFGPFLAAMVVTWWEGGFAGLRRLLGRLVQWRINPAWVVAAVLFPPVAYLLAIRAHTWWSGTPAVFPPALPVEATLLTFFWVLVTGGPLGEALGWRGFALPRLQARWSPAIASLILGLVWAGWHLPLWWIAEVPSYGWYLLSMVPLTYLFTCVHNHSRGSVLAAMLFHASLNTSLLRLPIFPAYREWTLILWAVAIILFLILRNKPAAVDVPASGPEPVPTSPAPPLRAARAQPPHPEPAVTAS